MSQITGPLVINDGAVTPVAKSFAPERVAPDNSVFTERSAAVSAGFRRLSVKYSPASSKRATNRIDVDFDLPALQLIDGVSKVAFVSRFKGYFVIPDTATAAERADLHAFVANSLDDPKVKAVIKDLDPMY
jgi:hypothetical protein